MGQSGGVAEQVGGAGGGAGAGQGVGQEAGQWAGQVRAGRCGEEVGVATSVTELPDLSHEETQN